MNTGTPHADLVRQRARGRCEYCGLPEHLVPAGHVVDHIIAQQHGGTSEPDNLALCCLRCNQYKGPNIAGLDPETGVLTRLFHPRRDIWSQHFRWDLATIVPQTNIGRVTIAVLSLNQRLRIIVRECLIDEGLTFE